MREVSNEGSLARKLRFHIFHALSDFEGSLARKLPFHSFSFHWREVSHESFAFTPTAFSKSRTKPSFLASSAFSFSGGVSNESFIFTSSAFTLGGKSRTKASFSHLPLSLLEGSLARKLRFHIFHFQFWREVSHESFVFTSSTFSFGGKSRTKASFSHLQLSVLEGSLARKLHFSFSRA